jgi:hypothetical protein
MAKGNMYFFRKLKVKVETVVTFCTGIRQSVKSKGKGHPGTGHKGPEGEQKYSSTLSLTSTLGVGVQRQALALLPSENPRYPLCRGLVWTGA